MTIEDIIKHLEVIESHIHGGDEEFDRQRKEAMDMAIGAIKKQMANISSEWISVKDRLPEYGGRVIVALDEKGTKICGGLDSDRIGTHGEWVRWQGYVTHWMPLPEPPKESDT